ncbi:hypothetical protein DFH28DRAFT_906989 [Melampsora americana]|nr:hypothetical protein DFH28DRAFT_906989 [Melampsora americana]
MGLSSRKDKQRIGDDPRNTKWARNEANPGFKLLSSMGWTPDVKTLGLTGSSSTTMTTWKKSPSGALPIIKSNTSGIGANPNTAPSYNGLGGAPCFVSSRMKENQEGKVTESELLENEEDRKEKIAIVGSGNGGGYSDLLSRLNQSKYKETKNQSLEDIKEKEEEEEEEEKLTKEGTLKRKKSKKSSKAIETQRFEKKKESKKLKKEKTHSRSDSRSSVNSENQSSSKRDEEEDHESNHLSISRPLNPRMAARSKYIKSKKLATSLNATAMAEILGIHPT